MSKILIDCFGGDNAPLCVIKAVASVKRDSDLNICLVGNKHKIKKVSEENDINISGLEIIDCETEINNDDNPMEILGSKKDSSMARGLQVLSQGKADLFISAGNSGALLTGANMIVKRSDGVRRIAFAPFVPKLEGHFLFLDAGASSQCTGELLYQFALMGSEYLQKSYGVKFPKIALLNIGEEENKGDQIRKEAYQLIKSSSLNFVGNIEPSNVLLSDVDVVVSDGFSGNIFLKTIEGMIKVFVHLAKQGDYMKTESEHIYLNPVKFANGSFATLLGARKKIIKLHSSIREEQLRQFILNLERTKI